MPEGPEVRREADRIGAVLADRRLQDIEFGLPRLEPYTEQLRSARVEQVTSRGKAMLIHFSNALTLFSHNQLYGKWVVCKRGTQPRTGRTLRAALHTANHSALLYSASTIEVLTQTELQTQAFLRHLGPDVLDTQLHWQRDIATRLLMDTFRRRQLATLLLDQRFLAGIGNYLRSEILFAARLAPNLRPQDLNAAELGRLSRAILRISDRAYQTGGITTTQTHVKQMRGRGHKRAAYRFAVFARQGLPCHRCDAIIERTTLASRRLYHCPVCQTVST